MSQWSRIIFVFFFLTGCAFLLSSLMLLRTPGNETAQFVYRTFDLPFFIFAVIFLFLRIYETLERLKKNSLTVTVLLAILAGVIILGLVYLNLFTLDR